MRHAGISMKSVEVVQIIYEQSSLPVEALSCPKIEMELPINLHPYPLLNPPDLSLEIRQLGLVPLLCDFQLPSQCNLPLL